VPNKILAYIAILRYIWIMELIKFIEAAECLKVLAHPARLKIVSFLKSGGSTVGEIATHLGVQSHVTSEHLRLMHRCGFLKSERSGRSITYSIKEPHLLKILNCIEERFGENHESNKRIKA
jgi:DNA-binding transcriptional ArsR family regulator